MGGFWNVQDIFGFPYSPLRHVSAGDYVAAGENSLIVRPGVSDDNRICGLL